MKVKIEFSTDNASFTDDFDGELDIVLKQALYKILKQVKRNPEDGCDSPEADDVLIDTNGNTIGSIVCELHIIKI